MKIVIPEMTPAVRPLYSRVPSLAVVAVRGADAEDFLRRQLAQNPPADETRFARAAWSDAKGRVRAVFDIARAGDGFVLVAERDGLESVLAKLRLYVLRSRIELSVDESLAVAAIAGETAADLESAGIDIGAEPGDARRTGSVLALRVGPSLVRLVGSVTALDEIGSKLEPASPEGIDLAEIRLGLPRVHALPERYVPQMLNLDRLDAVSFTKGCYPGQEVITRLHHRGEVKRRVCRYVGRITAEPPAPDTPLLDERGETIGEVLRAARAADGRIELLAVVRLDAADGPVLVGAVDGPRVERAPLPGEPS